MKIALSVDALSNQLTGIGRYAWELAKGVPGDQRVTELLLHRNGKIWPAAEQAKAPRRRPVLRRQWDRMNANFALRGALFHGPNFFLPNDSHGGIVTVHDLSVFRFPETHPAERVSMFEARLASTLDRAAHILTDCNFGRQELIDWFGVSGDKITAIPLGVGSQYRPRDAAQCRHVLAKYKLKEAGFILSVATYEPRKRVASAIGAYERVRSKMPVPPLVLVGAAGWKNTALAEQIDAAERRGSVISLGYVDEEDLPFLYASAGLFLFPSIYEGFGLPPIEAMASGVPTIVSNRSCLPEVTQGAAMLVDPDDIEGFAEAIERGLTDDRWRVDAVEANSRVAASYTWERCVEKTVDIYEATWSGRR